MRLRMRVVTAAMPKTATEEAAAFSPINPAETPSSCRRSGTRGIYMPMANPSSTLLSSTVAMPRVCWERGTMRTSLPQLPVANPQRMGPANVLS